MATSLKRTIGLLLLVSAIYLGFVGGRNLAAGLPRRHSLHDLTHLLSANAGAMAYGGYGSPQDGASNIPPADTFETVLDHVQHEFALGGSTDARLTQGALSRMLASLDDPKTDFLEPVSCKARQDALAGRFEGIGAVLTITKTKKADVDYRHLTIVDVMPGSPAEKAGLKSGDRVTNIDDRWVIAYSIQVEGDRISKEKIDDAAKRSEGEKIVAKYQKGYTLYKALPVLTNGEGKTLKLTVERAGQAAPLVVTLATAVTQVEPVSYRVVGGKVGYLQVRQFNAKATEAFQAALASPDPNLTGLIVDLRANPGGVKADSLAAIDGYGSARKLIALLTKGGKVATIERKPKFPEALTIAGTPAVNLPLVVLVDKGTANLSELVASALRDAGKAKVIGARTFGDPILQLFTVLKTGAGVEMTNAHLLTAAGLDWNAGLTPDVAVAAPVGTVGANDDAALKSALTTLGVSA